MFIFETSNMVFCAFELPFFYFLLFIFNGENPNWAGLRVLHLPNCEGYVSSIFWQRNILLFILTNNNLYL